jgi:hypothetical protein
MANRAHPKIADDERKRRERAAMHIQWHRDAFSAAHCIGGVKDVNQKSNAETSPEHEYRRLRRSPA